MTTSPKIALSIEIYVTHFKIRQEIRTENGAFLLFLSSTKVVRKIKHTEYDTETKDLLVEFNNGLKYEYQDVPHQLYTQFRMSESQGKFFSSKIAKVHPYKKL